jgi:hypothetical protein
VPKNVIRGGLLIIAGLVGQALPGPAPLSLFESWVVIISGLAWITGALMILWTLAEALGCDD